MTMKESTFRDRDGNPIKWESFRRNKLNKVVVIIARMVPSEKYVLIKQFRPAVNHYVIGFPAGIVETGNVEDDALKELKEETGYTGKIVESSPLLKSSPASMDVDMQIVEVEIEESDPLNQNPVQSLEPEEEIEVVLIKRENIKQYILKEKENGNQISAVLWYFLL